MNPLGVEVPAGPDLTEHDVVVLAPGGGAVLDDVVQLPGQGTEFLHGGVRGGFERLDALGEFPGGGDQLLFLLTLRLRDLAAPGLLPGPGLLELLQTRPPSLIGGQDRLDETGVGAPGPLARSYALGVVTQLTQIDHRSTLSSVSCGRVPTCALA